MQQKIHKLVHIVDDTQNVLFILFKDEVSTRFKFSNLCLIEIASLQTRFKI